MADTLLSIVQKAVGRIGNVDVPASVVGIASTNVIVGQMLALAIEEGEELVRVNDWSALTIEGATIVLVAGQELYPLPADFDRLVGGTQWDRTNNWRTLGPDDPQTARWRREGINQTAPRRALRQVGNFISVYPIPAAADVGAVIAFDYVSNFYSASAAGAKQAQWTADTDVPILRADLMIAGLKWRWRAAQGLEASVLRGDYASAVRMAIARDQGGGEVLTMGRGWREERGNCDFVVNGGPTAVLGTSSGSGIAVD